MNVEMSWDVQRTCYPYNYDVPCRCVHYFVLKGHCTIHINVEIGTIHQICVVRNRHRERKSLIDIACENQYQDAIADLKSFFIILMLDWFPVIVFLDMKCFWVSQEAFQVTFICNPKTCYDKFKSWHLVIRKQYKKRKHVKANAEKRIKK